MKPDKPAVFPEREHAEITCGYLYDYDTGESLGAASDRQTYLSLSVKHRFGGMPFTINGGKGEHVGVISENYATHIKRVCVRGGAVQDKLTGERFT
jgi:hypothetical protein